MSAKWLLGLLALTCACGHGASGADDLGTPDAGGSGCALAADTSATSTVTNGCALLSRDTSACMASRVAAGLGGAWLQFSCRVALAPVTEGGQMYVQITTDSQPDYTSNYFAAGDACYAAYTPSFPDPNTIAAQHLMALVPSTPTAGTQPMGLGAVGVAVNGVAIFDNQAAPGDDIFVEYESFDRCQGHPQMRGMYHYHSEPYALSYDDARLIGVMRDGYFLYGRRDADGSPPTLDAAGGHMGTTPDSPTTPVYHYHANLQTSMTPGTSGQTGWFLTTGTYAGAPGTCTGC